MKKIFVTGGAGFIGSAFVRKSVEIGHTVLNFDKLTYASDINSLDSVRGKKNYFFFQGDICDEHALESKLTDFSPDLVVHFAAESHVDNSIRSPAEFIHTNILGTFNLLNISENIQRKRKKDFRFIHISTDEVYGDLEPKDPKFTTTTSYKPNSPYAASKGASDHLVRAWHRTYGFPAIITHCSNNYGPWQNKEKFIPTVILNALKNEKIPVYGKGENIRDWIHVDDHVDALWAVIEKGMIGDVYNMGGDHELKNIDLAQHICGILQEMVPARKSYSSLITFVEDRLGHDRRYAIDNHHIMKTLGWSPKISFKNGIQETIQWYVRKYG